MQASWSGVGMIAVKVVENVVHHALDTQLDKAPVLSTTLDHPNVVAIYKVGFAEGCSWLLLLLYRNLLIGRCFLNWEFIWASGAGRKANFIVPAVDFEWR